MYYKTKSIDIFKDGRIVVNVADSNVLPVTYYDSEYHGTLAELLQSINDGNFHLLKNKNTEPFRKVDELIDDIGKLFDQNGLDFSSQFHYGLHDRYNGIKFACEVFADRMLSKNTISDDELFSKIDSFIAEGVKHLDDKKQADISANITRIQCASKSIFVNDKGEPLDILMAYETGKWLLAPEKDYNNGILETDSSNIIELSNLADSVFDFLRFNGVSLSLDEYIAKYPNDKDKIHQIYSNAYTTVSDALSKGAVLKPNTYPFKGYKDWTNVA